MAFELRVRSDFVRDLYLEAGLTFQLALSNFPLAGVEQSQLFRIEL
jgi:hypothetical protein